MYVSSTNFFFFNLVVLESICYSTRAKQLINEGNTTEGLRKIWTGDECIHACIHGQGQSDHVGPIIQRVKAAAATAMQLRWKYGGQLEENGSRESKLKLRIGLD